MEIWVNGGGKARVDNEVTWDLLGIKYQKNLY